MGVGYVPAYQTSGTPYVTSSAAPGTGASPPYAHIAFPSVTRFIEVTNVGNVQSDSLRVGFTANGIKATETANYITIPVSGSTGRLELRCKELFISSDTANTNNFSLVAGVTGILPMQFPVLTGSTGYEGVG
jgi:hypothetical protein